jgi:hypothetical protein
MEAQHEITGNMQTQLLREMSVLSAKSRTPAYIIGGIMCATAKRTNNSREQERAFRITTQTSRYNNPSESLNQ